MLFRRILLALGFLSFGFLNASCLSQIRLGAEALPYGTTSESTVHIGKILATKYPAARLKFINQQLDAQLNEASSLFKEGKLYKAFQLLNDDRVFEELLIKSVAVPQRKIIVLSSSDLKLDPKQVMGRVENHANAWCYFKCEFKDNKVVGEINTREVYVDVSSWGGLKKVRKSLWDASLDKNRNVQRFRQEEIRALFEEKVHALQLLHQATNGTLFTTLKGPLLASVLKMDQALNAHPHVIKNKLQNSFDTEADAYAYMLQKLGPENIPLAFGIMSGYPTRALVDAEIGRPWPKEIFPIFNETYGHEVFPAPQR